MKLQLPSVKASKTGWCLVLGACIFTGCWRLAFGAALEINISPTFRGEPLQLDSLSYQNAAGEKLSVTRLSYLLSGFALQRDDGSWLELSNHIAWLDAGQGRNAIRLENISPDTFRSLRFYVGLGTNLNHANPARFAAGHPLNPNLNGLHWNWQGGYIFMALEGNWRSAAVPATAAAKTETSLQKEDASTNSDVLRLGQPRSEAGTPLRGFSYHFARDPNCVRINLAAQLDLTHDTAIKLDFDVAALLNAPRPLSLARDGASTHSRTNDPVAVALAANFPGAFRVGKIESAAPTTTKTLPIKPLYLPAKYIPYRFKMSAVFPIPDLPRDNPLIEERVELGEKLFHETALSKDGSISCASCHQENAAFSDRRRFSVGVREQTGTRNGMPLFNLAWKNSFFWDGRAPSLRAQALMPIQDHTEMDEALTNVVAKLQTSRRRRGNESHTSDAEISQSLLTSSPAKDEIDYPVLFTAAFGSPEITPEKIGLAIEQFVLTLTSFDSKFDRAFHGEAKLTEQEQRGFELFMTEYEPRTGNYGADCFHCHGGALFSDHQFHNNGLNVDDADLGRFRVTKLESDRGKFSTPSLRNVELTAPYMHDGRFATLEEVIAHYDHGVHRTRTLDPNLAKHPQEGLHLTQQDQAALVAFLKTLTDEKFKTDAPPKSAATR